MVDYERLREHLLHQHGCDPTWPSLVPSDDQDEDLRALEDQHRHDHAHAEVSVRHHHAPDLHVGIERDDSTDVTITLPQDVWQAVEDELVSLTLNGALGETHSALLEIAIAALKGFESVDDFRAYLNG